MQPALSAQDLRLLAEMEGGVVDDDSDLDGEGSLDGNDYQENTGFGERVDRSERLSPNASDAQMGMKGDSERPNIAELEPAAPGANAQGHKNSSDDLTNTNHDTSDTAMDVDKATTVPKESKPQSQLGNLNGGCGESGSDDSELSELDEDDRKTGEPELKRHRSPDAEEHDGAPASKRARTRKGHIDSGQAPRRSDRQMQTKTKTSTSEFESDFRTEPRLNVER